jgi:molybdenum cofactor guanylyltransferase
MGQDKAWMTLDGWRLIERLLYRVLPLADEILLSARDAEAYQSLLRSLPVRGIVVPDQYQGFGPLAGIQAGLRAARNDLSLVVAVDMPFVKAAVIGHMVGVSAGYDGVCPRIYDPSKRAGALEPLHALYRRSCLPAIESHLAAGDRQAFCFFPDVRVRYVEPKEIAAFDPDLRSFFNVNTPEDWHRAQQLAAEEELIQLHRAHLTP